MVEVSILGISLQEDGKTPVLLLHPHGLQSILSLRIGPFEAFAISMAMYENEAAGPGKENAREPQEAPVDFLTRPLTHELLLKSVEALDGTISAVNLTRMEEGSFVAELVLTGPAGQSRIECRPSDGAALALRSGAVLQASDEVLSFAEDLETVMASLPEHIRTIAAAKLAAGSGGDKLPPVLEAVITANAQKNSGLTPHSAIISAARKMLEDERSENMAKNSAAVGSAKTENSREESLKNALLRHTAPGAKEPRKEAAEETAQTATASVVVTPVETKITKVGPASKTEKAPTIRISLVRQHPAGEAEVLDEFLFPTSGIPKEVLASLSLSQAEVKAVGNAGSEEDRWATLLRILSPETKVPM